MKQVKRGRGRPPLSAAEKARRAKEREALKMGAAPKRRGRPAGKPGRKPGSTNSGLNVAQVVTFANSLLTHEQSITQLIAANNSNSAWIKELKEFSAKVSETIAKFTETIVDLTNRLQKIEDAVDFSSADEATSEKPKRTKKVEVPPDGDATGVSN